MLVRPGPATRSEHSGSVCGCMSGNGRLHVRKRMFSLSAAISAAREVLVQADHNKSHQHDENWGTVVSFVRIGLSGGTFIGAIIFLLWMHAASFRASKDTAVHGHELNAENVKVSFSTQD